MTSVEDAVAADRIIQLEGGQNFREVGGYPTVDGRKLRRGLVWRSARLDDLTPADVERVHGLGIEAIADLRRPKERALNPTSEQLLARVRMLAWDSHGLQDDRLQAGLFKPNADNDHYFQAILDLYRMIAEEHAVHLRDLYQALAEGALPVLIHCAAGKDRTGIAVALLLEIIGVERAYVLADYSKTEQLLDWDRLTAAAALGTGVDNNWLEKLDPSALKLLFRSDERYLQATFDDLKSRYGSVTRFVIDRLGVSAETIEQLRDRLVEH
jgi:protein-tyrosine phosphatase